MSFGTKVFTFSTLEKRLKNFSLKNRRRKTHKFVFVHHLSRTKLINFIALNLDRANFKALGLEDHGNHIALHLSRCGSLCFIISLNKVVSTTTEHTAPLIRYKLVIQAPPIKLVYIYIYIWPYSRKLLIFT